MRFLVDAQLPPALARWLSAQGCPADHVADLGMAESPDRVIWEWASKDTISITATGAAMGISDTISPSTRMKNRR
jgi:predicted nuclease of predicted toxin-antitoxin system